jgi:molecular chaperone HscA
MARLEVTFKIDADGLLHVHALETTTGKEQSIEVKPTYGLTDEEVEHMLLEALDHGETDLIERRLAEGRTEAERVLLATRKSVEAEGSALPKDERAAIDEAVRALQSAMGKDDPDRIRLATEALEKATLPLAERRMNAAIAQAIAGKDVRDVEQQVDKAKGVDAHVEQHEKQRQPR